MGILDRIRGKKDEVLPEEVEKYYQSQRRARISTAWLLGFLTLVITLVIALGLFYGIRYAYRQITGPDETTEVIPEDANEAEQIPSETKPQDKENDTSQKPEQSQPDEEQPTRRQSQPETGDRLPANGDGQSLPATGDPGL